jgi:hypothetical protein
MSNIVYFPGCEPDDALEDAREKHRRLLVRIASEMADARYDHEPGDVMAALVIRMLYHTEQDRFLPDHEEECRILTSVNADWLHHVDPTYPPQLKLFDDPTG